MKSAVPNRGAILVENATNAGLISFPKSLISTIAKNALTIIPGAAKSIGKNSQISMIRWEWSMFPLFLEL